MYIIRHRFCYLLWQRHPLLHPLAVGGWWVPPAPGGRTNHPSVLFQAEEPCGAQQPELVLPAHSRDCVLEGRWEGDVLLLPALVLSLQSSFTPSRPSFSWSVRRESRDVLTPDLNYNANQAASHLFTCQLLITFKYVLGKRGFPTKAALLCTRHG